MSKPKRIYQIAKQINISHSEIVTFLKDQGLDVTNHMSPVDEETHNLILKNFASDLYQIEQDQKEIDRKALEEQRRVEEEERIRKAEEEKSAREEEDRSRRDAEEQRRQEIEDAKRKAEEDRVEAIAQAKREIEEEENRKLAEAQATKERDELERQKSAKKAAKPTILRPGEDSNKTTEASTTDKIIAKKIERKIKHVVKATAPKGRGKPAKKRRTFDQKEVDASIKKVMTSLDTAKKRKRRRDGRPEETLEDQAYRVSEFVSVHDFADLIEIDVADIISKCMDMGMMVTINQRIDKDTIELLAEEFEVAVVFEDNTVTTMDEEIAHEEVDEAALEPRPPVVTIMGHVDHGKTSLLDYLRKTKVVDGESGGITQHIGAYSVKLENGRSITFLDTPGHAAFTAMRARGARVTDLVILIVAADDNVMPQTIEAINHAKAAQVPLIVAINKCDLPTADPEKIKRELAENDVLIEDWGGKVACAQISATTGDGIDQLLESVILEAEVLELKAYPESRARGTVVEAQLDKGRGAVATVLVQEGTLRRTDPFVTGMYGGRVRALMDEANKRIDEVGPGCPVQVLGLGGVPQAGDTFVVVASERDAKDIVQRRQQIKRGQDARRRSVTLGDLQHQIIEGRIRELNVVVKGDVDGSVEAITQELGGITHEEVRISVIHSSVGTVTESDILLASASNAIIIAFHVPIDPTARSVADDEGVEIREYSIIYEVIEELRAALSGLLAPSLDERIVGTIEVREVFSSSKTGNIAGCYVLNGNITRNHKVRLRRGEEVLFEGSIASLRRFKDDVREVAEGFECGVSLDGFNAIENGDLIEAIEIVETARTL